MRARDPRGGSHASGGSGERFKAWLGLAAQRLNSQEGTRKRERG